MDNLEEKFKEACKNVTKLKNISDKNKLVLYGLYKQSTEGDCKISKPSFFDKKRVYMWEAWIKNEGMNKNVAKKLYIEYYNNSLK